MVALLGSIAHEAGRRPEPDWHRLGPGYRGRAPERALGHGDRGLRAAGLLRGLPEELRERPGVVGHDGLEQQTRPTGHAE